MTYDKLIETVSEIVENSNILKDGLILEYKLADKPHRKLQEHFFHTTNTEKSDMEYSDVFEIEIGGVVIRLVKSIE